MPRRFQARIGNGRFTRNTTENTFGLSVAICPWPDCRRFNPRSVGEAPATTCHACGRSMDPADVSPTRSVGDR
jgi:hypothetical protein